MDDDFTLVLGIVHLAVAPSVHLCTRPGGFVVLRSLLRASGKATKGVQYKKAKGRPLDSTSLPESLGSS